MYSGYDNSKTMHYLCVDILTLAPHIHVVEQTKVPSFLYYVDGAGGQRFESQHCQENFCFNMLRYVKPKFRGRKHKKNKEYSRRAILHY